MKSSPLKASGWVKISSPGGCLMTNLRLSAGSSREFLTSLRDLKLP
jgi:hypothetical protein